MKDSRRSNINDKISMQSCRLGLALYMHKGMVLCLINSGQEFQPTQCSSHERRERMTIYHFVNNPAVRM